MGKQKKHGAKKFEEYYGKPYKTVGRPKERERSIKHSRFLLEYTLSERYLKMHKNKGRGKCDYAKCNKTLKVGDRIVRKFSSRSNTRLFHKRCAQELNII